MSGKPIAHFRDALRRRGIHPPQQIVGDGKLHRCDAEGRNGKDDASYVLHLDGPIPAGGFQNWRDGLGWESWRANIGRKLSQSEIEMLRVKATVDKERCKVEDAKRHVEGQQRALTHWDAAHAAPSEHPYLTLKKIKAHGARVQNGRLVVPLRDSSGELQSLQFIAASGEKRYLSGGHITGCYHAIGRPSGVICIAEGFATAASVREATGFAVAVAFDAGNLEPVATALRAKYPNLPITICADDDYRTTGNPGITKAREAARAVNGLIAIPHFGTDRPDGATDFNDLHCHCGAEEVRHSIANARGTRIHQPQHEISAAAGTDSTNTQPREMPVNIDEVTEKGPTINGALDAIPNQSTLSAPDTESERVSGAVERLSALPPLEYDKVRVAEAEKLGVRVTTLDNEVSGARRTQDEEGNEGEMFPAVTPWPDPVNGAELLSAILETVKRFIVCDPYTAVAATLWIAFTWFVDHVHTAPLAVITAPEKRCGKTQLLSLFGKLVRRPLVASNISPAATFRVIDAQRPTLLLDEGDTFLRENEELRGVINSGHTRQAAYVIRTVGEAHEPCKFSTWSAKAIAGIGTLQETIMDRAIILELRRRLPTESVERLRYAEVELFDRLVAQLARFAEDAGPTIARARPVLPEALNDRAQDNWEPLLAIADHAGSDWSELARLAALKLSNANEKSLSLSTELLTDVREVFETTQLRRISTGDLLQVLTADDLNPWATYNRGKPMSPRQLAKRLEEFGVSSKNIKFVHVGVRKGFERSQFDDAFARYLLRPTDATTATPLLKGEKRDTTVGYRVAEFEPGSATDVGPATSKPAPVLESGVVADESQDATVGMGTLIGNAGSRSEPIVARGEAT